MKSATIIIATIAAVVSSVQGRIQQVDIRGLAGDAVRLPCEIDEAKCGGVHNIQWYRGDGDTRVFIFSEHAGVETNENMLQGRGYFHYTKGSSTTELEIRPLEPQDESLYKCELTYLEVRESCAVIQFVNLTTIAKPEDIRILLEEGTEVKDGAVIGPYQEDSDLVLRCESSGGKPAATVTWWNNTLNMGGDAGAVLSEDGTGVGTNVIHVPLTRHDLGSSFECQATNPAVEYPLRAKVLLDLHVRPVRVQLTGLEEPVMDGTMVTLVCRVTGARPAANVTWLRSQLDLTDQSQTSNNIQPDGTTETVSRYTFKADRSVNSEQIVCMATNKVIEAKGEPPLTAPLKIEVLYAPIVTVAPDNTTVNESMDILLMCTHDANPDNLTEVTWYRDDVKLDVSSEEKYAGGTPDQPSLFIKNASRQDAGRYRCQVSNQVGTGMADNEASIHVQFPPDVTLTVEPNGVREQDDKNITLRCLVRAGNPPDLLRVRWFLDGDVLRDLHQCNYSDTEMYDDTGDERECTTDPGEIMFVNVDRTFRGNYSCAGVNSAGWGPPSAQQELIVHYPPDNATLVYTPLEVTKGSSMNLTCVVNDPGYPPAKKFTWMRGTHVITDVTASVWQISPVSLEDDANFTCVATNPAGNSGEGQVSINVLAKPQFIERLPLYLGALINSSSISVTCRVECSPLCGLEWLKDGKIIEDSQFYTIKTSFLDPDHRTNDFESVVSTLRWNMSAWPNQMLDRVKDNANYTCRSTSNLPGVPIVSSTTFFSVEYPPENITVSPPIVDVVEGESPAHVRCTSKAYPDATYIWKHDDEAIQTGDELRLRYREGIRRSQAGEYVCHAQNKHGTVSTPAYINVLYKPECNIQPTEEDGEYLLVCDVVAVPNDVTFTWRFNNETLTEGIRTEGRTRSILTVQPGTRDLGTYYCHANNSVGPGIPCEIDVSGVSGWGMHLGDMNLIIVIAVVSAAVVLLLVLCVVVLLVCRRKKAKDKYGVPDALEERENPDGTSGSHSNQGVQPLHKWPIRPGVQVHVSNVQSLSKLNDSTAESTSSASANTKEKVVTFRRVDTDSDSKEDNLDGVGEAAKSKTSPNGSGFTPDDRTMYENLPFHSMHQAPKSVPEGGNQGSRPPSELSQNGSSGYGSTFSQGNPQYGSMRSQRSFQYGSTRSQPGELADKQQQQLLPSIPQSPDLPEPESQEPETNNNQLGRPTPPGRGPTAKPPYHNLSLPYRGHRARQRQAHGQPLMEQTLPAPHQLASRGFYSCSGPSPRQYTAEPVPPRTSQSEAACRRPRPKPSALPYRPPPELPAPAPAPARGPVTYNVRNGTVYADLEYGEQMCHGAPGRVQKEYVPTEYAVLQFSGVSQEIDV